jgi:hypothetical protein
MASSEISGKEVDILKTFSSVVVPIIAADEDRSFDRAKRFVLLRTGWTAQRV